MVSATPETPAARPNVLLRYEEVSNETITA